MNSRRELIKILLKQSMKESLDAFLLLLLLSRHFPELILEKIHDKFRGETPGRNPRGIVKFFWSPICAGLKESGYD